jgi:transcriptional regulator GlxA family with amidase domain
MSATAPKIVKSIKATDLDARKEYSVLEVADLLGVSRQTITRAFSDRPGVHVLPGRGDATILRIPGHVLIQWLRERTKT